MTVRRGGRFQRIKKPLNSDMNVVPYIDVMLVLLVIFMVTAPMISSGIKVDLPQANGAPNEFKDAPAIVTINKDGELFLNYQSYKDDAALEPARLEEILSEAQRESESRQQSLTVLVNGDAAASYGKVVSVMSSLQNAGLNQVGLLTEAVE